jgi:hypothetical protein
MLIRCILVLIALSAQIGFAGLSSAAVLTMDGSILVGATGLSVGNQRYDVRFADGSCTSLFNGCRAANTFLFKQDILARVANEALYDQVIRGTVFDTNPELISGCDAEYGCAIFTPYDAEPDWSNHFLAALIWNLPIANDLYTFDAFYWVPREADTHDSHWVYAVWSEANSVPEPDGFTLVLIGLVAMVAIIKSKSKVARDGGRSIKNLYVTAFGQRQRIPPGFRRQKNDGA